MPQRKAGARPPRTTSGEPLKDALVDRADAVGDAGAGGEHGQAGGAGELGGGLGREHRGLLVPYVDQAHRRVGLDRAVVEREDVRAGQREHRVDAVLLGGRHGELAAVTLDASLGRSVSPVVVAHPGNLPTRLSERGVEGLHGHRELDRAGPGRRPAGRPRVVR